MTKEEKLAIARTLLAEAEAEAKISRSTEATWRNDAAYYLRMADYFFDQAEFAENAANRLTEITKEIEAGKL
jgi:hypothetical protein